MKTKLLGSLTIMAAIITVACSNPASGGSSSPTLSSISVSPTTASLAVGGTQAVTVTGHYSDSSTKTLTDSTWKTSASAVATVSSGTITAVAVGTATVTATEGGQSATVAVTVTSGAVTVSAPTTLFSDSGLTFTVNPSGGTGTTEKTQINGWSGGTDGITNTTNTGPATITFGGHGSGWAGGVGLAQLPSNYTGYYDFTKVASIKFKIKSATLSPGHLTIAAQSASAGDQVSTLAALGVSDLTSWNQVTVSVATLFGSNIKTDVKTALAIYWGSSASDTTSNTVGDSYQIGDIQFLDGSGANVAFYSGVAKPAGVTGPTAAPANPTLASSSVVDLYDSSGTYTNPSFSDWSAAVTQSWAATAVSVSDDTTSVTGKTLKKFVFVNTNNFTGSDLAAPATITGKLHLHVSVYTPDGGPTLQVKIALSSSGANATQGSYTGTLTQGAWSDLEYDFSATGANYGSSTMDQLLFVNPSSIGTYWVDNIYFH